MYDAAPRRPVLALHVAHVVGNHYICFGADVERRRIFVYDSYAHLESDGTMSRESPLWTRHLLPVLHVFQEVINVQSGQRMDAAWPEVEAYPQPRQRNAVDCGVYCCAMVDHVAHGYWADSMVQLGLDEVRDLRYSLAYYPVTGGLPP